MQFVRQDVELTLKFADPGRDWKDSATNLGVRVSY